MPGSSTRPTSASSPSTAVQQLFGAAGFRVDDVQRTHCPIDQATPYDRELLPAGVEAAVAAMPEATTFQFVVVARPASSERVEPNGRR